jgi:hypothetical protein
MARRTVDRQQRELIAARGAGAPRPVERCGVRQSQGFGKRRSDKRSIANGRQRYEDRAGRAFFGHRTRDSSCV